MPERENAHALPAEFLSLQPRVRREIVWRLARTRSRIRENTSEAILHVHEDGEPAVIPALTVALEVDPDKLVKRHAAYGLASIQDESVIAPLREAALSSEDRATKGHAILAFGRVGAREVVPDLIALLDDRYARIMAADALVRIGDERALEPLRAAAAKGSPIRRSRLGKRVAALEATLAGPRRVV